MLVMSIGTLLGTWLSTLAGGTAQGGTAVMSFIGSPRTTFAQDFAAFWLSVVVLPGLCHTQGPAVHLDVFVTPLGG